jgi:hypothetical protein
MKRAPGPLIVLPSVWSFDPMVMAWSAMTSFPKIGNGGSGTEPDSIKYMREEMYRFPDATSVAYLRSHDYRSVVILKDQTMIPVHARVDPGRVPAASLGLRRIDMGDSVLYLVETRETARDGGDRRRPAHNPARRPIGTTSLSYGPDARSPTVR